MGLSSILERMHKGESLDQVIGDISPVGDDGAKRYRDTEEFASRFIKGAEVGIGDDGQPTYAAGGDQRSVSIVLDYLNHMLSVNGRQGRAFGMNGSILVPSDADCASPFDATKETSSDHYKIIESNRAVESTVPDSVAYAGGGKSDAAEVVEVEAAASLQAPDGDVSSAVPDDAQGSGDGEAVVVTSVEVNAVASVQASDGDVS